MLLALCFSAPAANPPYEAFLGTNGIVIRSNPPSGKILVDGAFITNGASAVFVTTNLFVVNNTYTSNLFVTNIFVDQSIITSNFFTVNNFSSNITVTNIFVNQVTVTSNLFVTNLFANTIISKDILWTNDNGTVRLIDQERVGIGTNSSDAMWLLEAGTNVINAFAYSTGGVQRFVINSNGEPSLLKGVTYSWPSAQGGAGTFLRNDGAGTLTWASAGAGGDSLWSSNSGYIYLTSYPTNVLLNPTNDGVGSGGASRTKTNFLFQTAVRRIGGTNQLFMVMNGGASAFVVGDQGVMIGSTNFIPVPQAAIDVAYDTAFGVDTPNKSILLSSYNSIVGYSGNTTLDVNTNKGSFSLIANKEGNGFVQLTETVGGGAWTNYDMQLFVQDEANTLITPYQIDPDFSLSPTGYIFGSTFRITNTHMLMSLQNSNFPVLEVDGVGDLRVIKKIPYIWPSAQGAAQSTLVNDGSGNLAWQTATAVPGILTGTTNFMNLSVQAAKLPLTNYPAIDAGWQAWETVYAETNAEGARVNTSATWQFMVPPDYATNSLKLLINYSLLSTNGPNASNVVWGASILSIRSGTTNNAHTNAFGAIVKGSNSWIAKYDGTNIVTNLVIDLGVNSLLMPRDLSAIKVERFPTEDTYGGAVSVHGLQLEYTRP